MNYIDPKGVEIMTGPELLERAAQAIANKPFCASGLYNLCEINGYICCWPRKQTDPAHRIFLQLTRKQCEEGMSPKEWNELEVLLVKHFKKDPKCLPLQKPS